MLKTVLLMQQYATICHFLPLFIVRLIFLYKRPGYALRSLVVGPPQKIVRKAFRARHIIHANYITNRQELAG